MKLLIVDDHEIVREGLSMILKQAYSIDAIEEASNGYDAIKLVEHYIPDLIFLDLSMPGGIDGLQTLEQLRKQLPHSKIVIFSMFEDIVFQRKAFGFGADGYLIKQLKRDLLIQSLDEILANKKVFGNISMDEAEEVDLDKFDDLNFPITKREKEVFTLTVLGYTQKDIADKMDISVKTVENYRKNISKKLNTNKRHDWVDIARKHNFLLL